MEFTSPREQQLGTPFIKGAYGLYLASYLNKMKDKWDRFKLAVFTRLKGQFMKSCQKISLQGNVFI